MKIESDADPDAVDVGYLHFHCLGRLKSVSLARYAAAALFASNANHVKSLRVVVWTLVCWYIDSGSVLVRVQWSVVYEEINTLSKLCISESCRV